MPFNETTLSHYQVKTLVASLKIARWLLTKADSKGLTHGEKHYLIQTVLFILADTQNETGIDTSDLRNEITVIDPSDIPF